MFNNLLFRLADVARMTTLWQLLAEKRVQKDEPSNQWRKSTWPLSPFQPLTHFASNTSQNFRRIFERQTFWKKILTMFRSRDMFPSATERWKTVLKDISCFVSGYQIFEQISENSYLNFIGRKWHPLGRRCDKRQREKPHFWWAFDPIFWPYWCVQKYYWNSFKILLNFCIHLMNIVI